MPTTREVQARINELVHGVTKCLERCKSVPGPSAERYDRISVFASTSSNIANKFGTAMEAAIAQNRRDLTEHQKILKEKNDELRLLQRDVSQQQQAHQKRRAELQQQRAQPGSAQRAALDAQINDFQQESQRVQS
jgi:DNA repair ATPase RecN